jgi:hypothetical protein
MVVRKPIKVICKSCERKYLRTGTNRQRLCISCSNKSYEKAFSRKDFPSRVSKSRYKEVETKRLLLNANLQNKSIGFLLK